MWMTGTYDPELNLLFVGTGNPTPVLNGEVRPGDNRWTCSIVALNPDTGTLAWGFQASPHDTHDWDASEVPVLVDAEFGGVQRKLLLQASRNGYYFVLDRTTGKNLLTTPFAAANWASSVDEAGRPQPESRQGAVARRAAGGARRTGRHQLPFAELRSGNGLLLVSATTPTASTSSRRSTASTGGPGPITASTVQACSALSTTARASRGGLTISTAATAPPACSRPPAA
jgi:alcohol dehydrogenase (cytochrome c)